MGKAARSKAQNEEKRLRQEEKRRQEAKRKKIELTVALSAVALVVIALCSVLVANKIRQNYLDSGKGLREVTAMSTENYTVDNAMLTYFIYNDYYYYVNYYGENASYYGIDEEKDLSEQIYDNQSGETWLDYCTEEAVGNLKSMLILCEDAKKNGFTLSEEDKGKIDTMLETVTPSDFGRGVNIDDIRKCLEISYLASEYQNSLKDGITVSDEEIESYYNENAKDYQTAKYISYKIEFADPDDEASTKISEEEAKNFAEALKNAKSVEEFKAAVTNHLKATQKDITEEQIQTKLDAIIETGINYNAEQDIPVWAFEEGRAQFDTNQILNEDNNYFIVYMLTQVPTKNEDKVVDVRHILFNFENYDDKDSAKKAAKDVLNKYNEGEKTEESFTALATQYNEDPGSKSSGGLYEGVYVGQMVQPFNDWCFDESRKEGDVGLVETEYGYHVMYFVKDGGAKYKHDILGVLETEKYNTRYEEIEKLYPVTVNNDAISKITGKVVSE